MTLRTRTASLVAASALLLGLASPALAQPDPPPTPARAAKATKATKATKPARVKVLTIEEETIEGGVPSGQIIPVDARTFADRGSLIRIRHSFVDLILKDAENL